MSGGEKRPWRIDSVRKNGTAGHGLGVYRNPKGADLDLETNLAQAPFGRSGSVGAPHVAVPKRLSMMLGILVLASVILLFNFIRVRRGSRSQ